MLLSRVIVSPDTLYACLSHALSTEHQEIMGLLLGSLISNETEAYIQRSMVLSRKDKKKDRVEVSYADLGLASTVAEDLSMTIVGWYHSHPHITVLPSHVDVKTQGQYQVLGKFLGLIFSVFDKGQLEMCAFQSKQNRNGEWERVEIPVIVGSPSLSSGIFLQSEKRLLESMIAMQMVLMNEDKETLEASLSHNKQTWSHLNVLRPLSVFQSGIFRLVDLQIFPLLMGMRSKISTLRYERDRTLKLLKCFDDKNLSASASACKNIDNYNKSPTAVTNLLCVPAMIKHTLASNTTVSSADDSKENSDRSLRTLTKTIPKYTRSVRALRLAFSGFSAELMNPYSAHEIGIRNQNDGTGLCKGQYNMKIKKANVSCPLWGEQSSVPAVPSPWLLEFEAIKMETEAENGLKRSFFQFPLLAVNPSFKPSHVDFTVLIVVPGKGTSIERPPNSYTDEDEMIIEERSKVPGTSGRMLVGLKNSSSSSSSSSPSYKKITITVQIKDNDIEIKTQTQTQYEVQGKFQSKSQSQSLDGVSSAMLIREDLHCSLKLHLWPPQ